MERMKTGQLLKGPQRNVTWEKMVAFESVIWDRGATSHNDRDTAKKGGMGRPFASGQNTLAFFHELFEREFGRGWIEGGTISVRWTRLVYEGDAITPFGEVTAVAEKDGRTLVSMKVWAENQDGEHTAAGTATAFLQ